MPFHFGKNLSFLWISGLKRRYSVRNRYIITYYSVDSRAFEFEKGNMIYLYREEPGVKRKRRHIPYKEMGFYWTKLASSRSGLTLHVYRDYYDRIFQPSNFDAASGTWTCNWEILKKKNPLDRIEKIWIEKIWIRMNGRSTWEISCMFWIFTNFIILHL